MSRGHQSSKATSSRVEPHGLPASEVSAPAILYPMSASSEQAPTASRERADGGAPEHHDLTHARLGCRDAFPRLEARAYVAHCAISPLSGIVERAIARSVERSATWGIGGLEAALEVRERLRARLARLLQTAPAQIGLVANTSAGISTVALDLDWRAGDGLVYFEGEFPTNVTPWQQAAKLFDLRVFTHRVADFSGDGGAGLEALERRLSVERVRLVAVSAVQFNSGLRMPVEQIAEICHRHGALCFVDAIQLVGSAPFDIEAAQVDFASIGSHKWLMGTEGLGVLYVRAGREELLVPRTAAWLSHVDPIDFLLAPGHLRYDKAIRRGADFVEAGAPNFLGICALEASTAALEAIGLPQIHTHIQRYLDAAEAYALRLGWRSHRAERVAARSAILSITPPPYVELASVLPHLSRHKIVASAPDGYLRIAPHWHSSLEDVEHVGEALASLGR